MNPPIELVSAEYEFPKGVHDALGHCLLYLEFFASKSVCAYDIQTGEVKLIRKIRKKLDQVVHQELLSMEIEILQQNSRILPAVDHCSQRLETLLQKTNPLGENVRFGSIGIDGIAQTNADDALYLQEEQAIVERYRQLFLKRNDPSVELDPYKW
ncbi:hypothetical protein KGD04_002520 [Enterococcus hirae]|nr:hypothetical protein [Enterococcus hirae]EMF0296460.1 hypothetical protein [Enterococcus hirae]